MCGHFGHDLLSERLRLSGRADQDRGVNLSHRLGEADAAKLLIEHPVRDLRGGTRVGSLEVAQIQAIVGE